ncbi:MAG: riboflavin synthase [Planctomycetota bacterium]
MFTGIIRMLAPVEAVRPAAGGARIVIDLEDAAAGVGRGDSVSVNGACLTVAEKRGSICEFDAVAETLSRTTLGSLRPGDRVNIEPSLRVGDQLGGHFVLGHIDGVGEIAALTPAGDGADMRISADAALTALTVPKGSVAVDGISLTLVDVGKTHFTCAIIPTTLQETTLGSRKPGDKVNVETDLLGKMVAKLLASGGAPSGVTLDKLRKAGFA